MRKIISELNWGGDKYILEYSDSNGFDNLPYENCQQVYGVCFVKNKLLIVFGEGEKDDNRWGLAEGHVGKFEKDPAGSVSKIKMIDPKEYKKYFDWGEIGDRIIDRAVELKNQDCGLDL